MVAYKIRNFFWEMEIMVPFHFDLARPGKETDKKNKKQLE
jgi:hypothetical protein